MAKTPTPAARDDEWATMHQEIDRLTAMLQQYEADMRLIDQVSQTLGVGFARLEQLYERIYDQIAAAVPVDAFYIVLATPGSNVGHFPLLCDNGVRYPPEDRPLGPLLRWILEQGEPLHFDDVYVEAAGRFKLDPVRYGQEAKGARSWLGVPMRVRGEIKGVVSIQNYRPALYGSRERRLLSVIASQSAVAIENARLFQQVQQTVAELSTPIVPV
ncbi:MAG: GAF domain-containing protein, partial [Anaerolineae bacterium]